MSISYRKILAFAPALCMLLCGCHDDDVTASGEGGGGGTALHTYVYDVHVPNADGTRTVYIDSVSGNLTSTSPLPAWCKVEQTGTYNGRPVISLSYTGSRPDEIRKGTNVTLYFSDRNAAVTILEKDCTARRVMEEIQALLADPQRREDMSKTLRTMVRLDSTQRICDIVEGLVKER